MRQELRKKSHENGALRYEEANSFDSNYIFGTNFPGPGGSAKVVASSVGRFRF
jgi:hypothetical protein